MTFSASTSTTTWRDRRRRAGPAYGVRGRPWIGVREILSTLVAEITQDRVALITIMGKLGIPIRGYKVFAGWVGEKAGRAKLNRHLLTRSPLSALEETELLRLGVEGKAAGWRSLRSLAERDSRLDADRLDELLDRAKRQSDMLETLRIAVAERVLTTPAGETL